MGGFDCLVLEGIIIGQPVPDGDLRHPHALRLKMLQQKQADDHRRGDKHRKLRRDRACLCEHVRSHRHKPPAGILQLFLCDDQVFPERIQRPEQKLQLLVGGDQGPDLPVFLIKLLKTRNLMGQKLPEDLLEMLVIAGKGEVAIPGGDLSDPDILCRDQLVLVENRDLEGIPADVDDCGSLLDHGLEGFRLGRDGLIVQETLLRIREDRELQAGPLLNIILGDQRGPDLPEGARTHHAVAVHMIPFHDLTVFLQRFDQALHLRGRERVTRISVTPQIDPAAEAVKHMKALPCGDLIQLHLRLGRTDQDGSKYLHSHSSSSIVPSRWSINCFALLPLRPPWLSSQAFASRQSFSSSIFSPSF